MRAIVSVLFVLVAFVGAARAQPGPPPPPPAGPEAAPPQPYPPAAQPMPPQPYPPQPYGQPYPPQPYPYPPPQTLTPEEQKLLAQGEISLVAHAGGVALNWFFGFGIGQAVQGRWSDTGWIFTLGEAGSITLFVVGFVRAFECSAAENACNNDDAGVFIASGLIGYLVFHAWSIVDAAVGPANHNRKVRDLKRRLGMPVMEARRIIPYTSPVRDPVGGGIGGGVAGLTFRF
jgi:hypothetical protein